MREQRLVFGEDAELYDRARPGYSAKVVDDVLAFTGVAPADCRALEIGAGTGKATVAFASRGVRVVALEPDPAMASVAARNCRLLPAVEVLETAFEDWPVEAAAFDLVFSAQAWHWVRPEVRCGRAAAALRAGGTIALMWHRVSWRGDEPVRAALDACYREHAPSLHERNPGFPGLTPTLDEVTPDELRGSGSFVDVVVGHHAWRANLTTPEFLDLLGTQSDHRLLPERTRVRLFQAVGSVLESDGGKVAVPYETYVVLAHSLGPDVVTEGPPAFTTGAATGTHHERRADEHHE